MRKASALPPPPTPLLDRRRKSRNSAAALEEHPPNEEDEVSIDEHVTINSRFLGRPIEEVDPFIIEDTFCVLSTHFGTCYVNRFSATSSLYIFTPLSRIRRFAIKIATNQYFDIVIILTIIAQIFLLASGRVVEDPKGSGNITEPSQRIEESPKALVDFMMLVVYTFECLLKILAKGFIMNKFAYLRNKWNTLDFACVVAGWVTLGLEYTGGSNPGNLDFLRTFRVLRAVKTISVLPGLRMMINALLRSVVQLIEVMALTCFCLIVFSLIGLQMFMGKLLQKCVIIRGGIADTGGNPIINPDDPLVDLYYNDWVNDHRNWLMRDFPEDEFMPCGNGTYLIRSCPNGYVCLKDLGGNPDDGWTSFDNFFNSMLTTFQLITLDYWERPYELVMSTNGWFSLFYFLTVVFLGYFYLLNLMLAVVSMSYEEELSEADFGPKTKYQQLTIHRQDSSFSFKEPVKLSVKLMAKYRRRTPSERELMAQRDRKRSIARRAHRTESFEDQVDHEVNEAVSIIGDDGEPSVHHYNPLTVLPKNVKTKSVQVFKKRTGFFGCMKHVKRALKKMKMTLKPIVNHFMFDAFITICIILNTIILSIEHNDSSYILENISKIGNITFTVIFTLEFLFKLFALQKEYFKSYWNLFDLFIVTASWIEIVYVEKVSSDNAAAFGSLRLLRVFKLAQSWITMKILLNIIFSTLGALINLIIVLLLVIYIFAVLGMQLLGEGYTEKAFCGNTRNPSPAPCDGLDEKKFPPWRFDHFGYAFMMVFRILCGEWIEPMWECLKAQQPDLSLAVPKSDGKWKCYVIFIAITIVGTFIILNLFVALLLNSFNTEELNAQRDKELEATGKSENLKRIVGIFLKPKEPGTEEDGEESEAQISPMQIKRLSMTRVKSNATGKKQFRLLAKKVIIKNRKAAAQAAIERAEKKIMRVSSKTTMMNERKDSALANTSSSLLRDMESPQNCCPKVCWEWNIFCTSELFDVCCCWNCWEKTRKFCFKLVFHPYFEWFILFFIFASSFTLCFEDIHLERNLGLQQVLLGFNLFFTVVFIIEMFLKIMAFGWWTYFTDVWCILDAFIVVVNVIAFYFEIESRLSGNGPSSSNIGSFKALRTLRAFRPLRAISRWQGMKVVVNALIFAIPSIINVLLVCLLFWLVFSIMGVQLFKGKFYRCIIDKTGELVPYREKDEEQDGFRVHDKDECCSLADSKGYSWVNFVPNFDNVFEAYLSLFQIATYEGWMEIMKLSVDFGVTDEQHKTDRNMFYYLYYVIFIVLGSFFTLNLFIGVIIDNFNMLKKKYEGNLLEIFLTPNQRHYYTALKKLGRKKPKRVIRRPDNNYLALFYDISMSRKFEIWMFFIIFINMIAMSLEYHGQEEIDRDFLRGLDVFFFTVYALEVIVKIIGLRHHYFTLPWNFFDIILVLISGIDYFFYQIEVVEPAIIRIIRVFRVGRILRFIKAAKGIRKLLFALIVSLPALYNIGALLALITFIYAILGMNFFGRAPKYETYDDFFNFETFVQSCLVLLRLMTSAGWNEVYDALMQSPPTKCGNYRKLKCDGEGEPECIDRVLMTVYIVSYIAICWHIVINMYIAVILENFVEANNEEEIGIIEDDLDMFYARWGRYDPAATQFIKFDSLPEFLAGLDAPLTFPRPNIVAIGAFDLPIARGNKIHCLDILHALVKNVLGNIEEGEEFSTLQVQMEKKFRKQFPERKILKIISSTKIWKIQHNAAIVIQRAWRAYRGRKHPHHTHYHHKHQTSRRNSNIGFMNRMGETLARGKDHKNEEHEESSLAKLFGAVKKHN